MLARRLFAIVALLVLSVCAHAQVMVQTPTAPHHERTLSLPKDFFRGRVLSTDPTLPLRLQTALDSQYALTAEEGKRGVGASVIAPNMPQWTSAAGMSDIETNIPLDTNMLFEIGSNTKTFVTALIFQLIDSGKIALADKISKYLPHITNVDTAITIKELLAHTSGVYDYLNDDTNATGLIVAYNTHPDSFWTAGAILGLVGPPNFKHGRTIGQYSNSGFILLGLIADSVLHMDAGRAIRTRLIDPLGLSHTYVGWEKGVAIQETFAHNWIQGNTNYPDHDLSTIPKIGQLSLANTAGGIVSTPGDLARWAKALYEGHVVSAKSLGQMKGNVHKVGEGVDSFYYGLGTLLAGYGKYALYGHGGALPGFYSDMFDDPADSIAVVIYMNSAPEENDVQLNDYAIALLNEIYRPASAVESSEQPTMQAWASEDAGRSTLHYILPSYDHVSIELFNPIGQKLATLADDMESSGVHSVAIAPQTSVTFCRIVVGGKARVVKIGKTS